MKRPSKQVLRGLDVLIPVIAIITETPGDSELQECSDAEVEAAGAALQWIIDLVNAEDAGANPTARGGKR